MHDDIQFGEVQSAAPEAARRPDQDAHWAVAKCGDIGESDLAIFIDLDVMSQITSHALSNTNIELGGILLGGQFVDTQGRPFVVVRDLLQAEHYEATAGSFKFTHDTWQAMARQRDKMDESLQIIGWYHTHPGWGVFLSGMDRFICEQFFARPSDVALVVDPCRDEVGWFQWTGDGHRTLSATDGYYLFTHRIRANELPVDNGPEESAVTPEEDSMRMVTRASGRSSENAPTVIHMREPGMTSGGIAVIAAVLIGPWLATLVIVLWLSWGRAADSPGNLAEMQNQLHVAQTRIDVQREMLSAAVGNDGDPHRVAEEMTRLRLENQQLHQQHQGQLALTRELQQHQEQLDSRLTTVNEQVARLQADLATARREAAQGATTFTTWHYAVMGAIALVLMAGSAAMGYVFARAREAELQQEENAADGVSEHASWQQPEFTVESTASRDKEVG